MQRAVRVGIGLAVIALHAVPGMAQAQRLPEVIYMDQPTGIDYSVYVANWPQLEPYIARVKAFQSAAVLAELRQRTGRPDVTDGELNLQAQLEWQRGDLDAADRDSARAVALQPRQALNSFQLAMVDFAHLRRATGPLEQWKWQQKTRDAYQRTFDLDPRNVSARYYLAYSYMNTPWVGGGDKKKALELAEGGIALGQIGFYAVRADAHRVRGELDAAHADYDRAIQLKVIKLGGFLDAAQEELSRGQRERARRYLEWALQCRPDAAKAHEGMGDYYLAINDLRQAEREYRAALEREPGSESTKKKLARVMGQ